MLSMDHTDHVNLLRAGVPEKGGTWADFGAGSGAFTLALAELLGRGGVIYAVDRSDEVLHANERAMQSRFPESRVRYIVADFTLPLELPLLDGMVIANALHYQNDQKAALQRLRGYLRPAGRVLVVEYNIMHPNSAVPHPLPFVRWVELASEVGFAHTRLLVTRPSRSLREIYSAASW